MDGEEGVKCLSTHLKQPAVPLRALSFMTAGERRRKMEREGEDKRMEREEKQVRLAVISRSSVSCDTMGTKTDNHPKATFFVELQCLLKGLAVLYFTEHFNFIY